MKKPGNSRFDIIIAGGGFIGLTLARALSLSADNALKIAVVDRVSPIQDVDITFDGRASALSAASMQMLTALGIWQFAEDGVQPIYDIEITDSELENTIRPPFLQFESTLSGGKPASYMVENYKLRQAIINITKESQAITCLSPESVTGFDARDHHIDVILGDGQKLRSALLIAADGRNSKLRDYAKIKTVSWTYQQSGIVATVAHERPHEGRAVQHFLPAGPFAILPLKGNRSSLVWTEERSRAREILSLEDDAFLEELSKRFGRNLGELTLAGPRAGFPLEMHLARRFISNRFALIGDAAHGVHPIAGQGLNIGFRDVAALTEIIVEAKRLGLDIGSVPILERYQQWRRFDSAFSTLVMDGLNRLFSNDSVPLRIIRDIGLGLVDRAPPLKNYFVQEAAGLNGDIPKLLRGELV